MGQSAASSRTSSVRRRSRTFTVVLAILSGLALALPAGAAAAIAVDHGAHSGRGSADGASLASVTFTDAAHGWALGSSGGSPSVSQPVLLATADGGATWTRQDVSAAGSGASLSSICFVDASHGWAVGHSSDGYDMWPLILATTDGGVTWNVQVPGYVGDLSFLSAVTFVDANHGWAVGSGGDFDSDSDWLIILATDDGGATWSQQDPGYYDLLDGMGMLNAVSFVDAKHGWAVGSTGGSYEESPLLLATTDGGQTWEAQQPSNDYAGLYALDFVDAARGWAVGGWGGEQNGAPALVGTSNGGATWGNESPPAIATNSFLEAVDFVDATHGWAVGTRNRGYSGGNPVYVPVILATTDGGASWQARDASSASTPGGLASVTFTDAAHGWAVGSSGTIIATSDGGATWSRQHGLVRPQIAKLRPAKARRGVVVTITGSGFGKKSRASCVRFGGAKCTRYVSWSATRIKCKVPTKAKIGRLLVKVITAGGESSGRAFRVRR